MRPVREDRQLGHRKAVSGSDAPSLTVFFFQDAFCCSLLFRRSIAFRRTDGRGLPSSPLITGMNVSVGSKALT